MVFFGLVWFFFALFLAMPHDLRDPSSPARDGTSTLGSESLESSPLDGQGIPFAAVYMWQSTCLRIHPLRLPSP